MKTRNKEKMYSIVERWFQSPGLKEDFCKTHGVNLHKLNYWIKKYNKENGIIRKKPAPSGDFIPLTVKESLTREQSPTPEIELDLPHGIRLRIF
jgi:transposase-like protein